MGIFIIKIGFSYKNNIVRNNELLYFLPQSLTEGFFARLGSVFSERKLFPQNKKYIPQQKLC